MAKKTCCAFPYCERPVDTERDAGLCSEHSDMWLRSREFMDAARDENVRAAMALGLKKQAMRRVASFRRKWAKRVSGKGSHE